MMFIVQIGCVVDLSACGLERGKGVEAEWEGRENFLIFIGGLRRRVGFRVDTVVANCSKS